MFRNINILNDKLEALDPELNDLINQEKNRQKCSIEMIASENFTSVSVLQCLSSCTHNKYSEGLPGKRYYGGNEFIDKIELLAQKRALDLFDLNSDEWGVNVQPYSGSPANLAVYTGLLQPHDRIMGLDLPDGGHLTHGFMTSTKKISASSIFFESMPYKVNEETGIIDYDSLESNAKLFKPKIIIAGISCYSRCLDYKRFKKISEENNAYLFSDMSHVAGLVAAKLIPSPFEYSDIVSTTTHKTLRGPRAGIIFFKKKLENKINSAVFPGIQGGPHNNTIAAIATAMKQAKTPEFIEYQKQVLLNSKHLSNKIQEKGYTVVTGSTDIHLVLIDLRNINLNGACAEYILEQVFIVCNKNTIPGDKSALYPSGIRLGTPAITTRGYKESDIDIVVEFIDCALNIAKEVIKTSGNEINTFIKVINEDINISKKIKELRQKVKDFSVKFPLPNIENL